MNKLESGICQRALAVACVSVLCCANHVSAATPQIRLGADHALLLKGDGTVWQWGTVEYGTGKSSLPSCYPSNRTVTVPEPVSELSAVVAIAATGEQSIALRADGTVWQWGRDPQYSSACTPIKPYRKFWQVADTGDSSAFLTRVVAIWAGGNAFFARKDDGSVVAWGNNELNKLGVAAAAGSTKSAKPPPGVANVTQPLVVARLTTPAWPPSVPRQVVAGGSHALALLLDNSVRAWGAAQYGERGDGTMGQSMNPYWDGFSWNDHATSTAIDSVTRLAAGVYKSAAVRADGSLWVWGCNQSGELGNAVAMGSNALCARLPAQVVELNGVADVAMGDSHTTVLLGDGTVWAMGYNGNYALGAAQPAVTRSQTPLKVAGVTGIGAIDAEGNCSLALKQDGTLWQWGSCPGSFGLPTQIAVPGAALTPACGPATAWSASAQPAGGLCLVGQASVVNGNGPWSWSCSQGGNSVSCTAPNGPTFLLQPAGGRYWMGRSATLRVIAEGKLPLTYQWYKQTANGDVALVDRSGLVIGKNGRSGVMGAKTQQLTMTALFASDGGSYFVEVRDAAGTASRSQTAVVGVISPITPTRPDLRLP